MATMLQELEKFHRELKAYITLPQATDDVVSEARANVCEAHAIRVEAIMASPDLPADERGVTFGPGDCRVVVSVPTGFAPLVLLFDREDPEFGAVTDRDLLITCTLLEHALGQARRLYSQTKASTDYRQPPAVGF